MTLVAITGARGFLGTYTATEFEAHGATVVRIGRSDDGRLIRLDSGAQAGLLDGVDVVVHLAGQLALPAGAAVADYLDANVTLTEQVVRSAIEAGTTRFVYSSSRLVYPATLARPAREDDAAPDNEYGMSKWFAERVVALHTSRSATTSTSVRLSQLVGRGSEQGAVAAFALAARRGDRPQVIGAGRAVRDVLDVRDAARAIRLVADAPTAPPVLNVGAGGRTIADLATAVAESFGFDDIRHVPAETEDASHWSLDCTLARDTIGWVPNLSLADTVHDHFGS